MKANFIEKLKVHSIENFNLTLEVLATNIDVNQKMIDDVVTDVCSSLKLAASDAGVVTSDKHRRKPGRARQQPLQPWFSKSCEENRKIYQKSKRKYRENKTDEHLISMQNASRAYKNKNNKSFREYQSDLSKKFRNLKSSNPKEYWNLLNGHTRSQNSDKPDLDTLKEHFRKLNAQPED